MQRESGYMESSTEMSANIEQAARMTFLKGK